MGILSFDGVDDTAQVTDSETLDLVGNTLTLSCWVKRQGVRGETLLKKADSNPYGWRDDSTHNGYRLSVATGWRLKLELWSGGTVKTVTSRVVVPWGRWCHLAGRYDGSELRVFINGTKWSSQ